MKWVKFITCGLILWAIIIIGLFASIRWAGAHQFSVTTDTRCLPDNSTWVEWSFENDTPRTFTIVESTPSLPPEIAPSSTITAITILPPGWTGTVYADIRGYWTQPDDSLLWWADGATLTLEENQCASTPTTAPTTTTTLPPPVEKVQVTSTTTGGTPTGPDSTPTTATGTTTTGVTVSPTTTTTAASMLDAGNITGPATTTTTLADTGNPTTTIVTVALLAIVLGWVCILGGRRKP